MTGKLAINGGKMVVPEGMPKAWPVIDEGDIQAVSEVLKSGILWGNTAPNIKALEEEWASYVGVSYCLALNSGTAALHGALAAAGVGPGDEVIVPAYSFYSTATPIVHQNAIPVFVDIDPRTFNIDPGKIEAKITEKTKAIMVVHLWGLPADMDEIRDIAKRHGLFVIEDACQAHGATYKGKKAGALGDMAAFSLNGSKNLPAAEGGLFTTNDLDLRNKAARLEMTVRIESGQREYPTYSFGWNYRMNELIAALARSQLRKLDHLNSLRIENCKRLTKHLKEIQGVIPPFVPADRTHVYHMYRVRFDPKAVGVDVSPKTFRDKVEAALKAEGVPVGQWVTEILPNHQLYRERLGYGKGCPWSCPHARKDICYDPETFEEEYPEALRMLEDSTLVWNFWPPNTPELMDLYAEAFRKVFSNLDELF